MQTQIQGMNCNYIDEGEGRPVLHLHGYEGEINSFAPTIQHGKEEGFRVLSLDLPGFGESEAPPEAWSITEYAQFLRDFLEEREVTSCSVIAHSFGARIAVLFASQWPEYFDRMVLTGAAGLIPKRGAGYYFRTWRYKVGKRMAKIQWMNRLFHLDERQKSAGSSEYQRATGTMRGTYVRVVNQNLKDCLPKIVCPTLLVWGSEDTATPLWMGQTMEKLIPDAGLVVFEGCGHFAYLEEYARFETIVDSFLGR